MTPLPHPVCPALAVTGTARSRHTTSHRAHAFRLPAIGAFAAMLLPIPAQADQFIEAADNATIDCQLSRGELTRIALIEDGFANVSKIASGYPYNDFEVTHEPVRGDNAPAPSGS